MKFQFLALVILLSSTQALKCKPKTTPINYSAAENTEGTQCKYDFQCSGILVCRSSKCALPSPQYQPTDSTPKGANLVTSTKSTTPAAEPTTTSVIKYTPTPAAEPTTTSVIKYTPTPAVEPTTTSVKESTPTPAAELTTTSVKESTPTPAADKRYVPSPNDDDYPEPGSPSAKLFLDSQNECRRNAGIPDLYWSATLESDAREYASYLANSLKCKLVHSPIGENLHRSSSIGMPQEKRSISAFCKEPLVEFEYNHHSQVVWKNSIETGCASVSSTCGTVTACRYFPPGNTEGHSYKGKSY